jgi:sugar/nucleoside kinase (ribokinase family)
MANKIVKRDIIVIGELNIDVIASGLKEAPKLGTEVLANDFQLTLGSASAIFACGIAKLGHEVAFVSKVGTDDFGKFCLKALREAGVSTARVVRAKDLETGVTISLSTGKDRALVTYPGAISALGPDDIGPRVLNNHRHLHMTSYFLQTRLQSSFSGIFREARQQGLSTSFDPNSDPSDKWTENNISEVLNFTDLLFLNEPEALRLTKTKQIKSALKVLGERVPCAVVKLGRKGAIAIENGRTVASPAFKVEVKDTTGAGDSFAAGFVSAHLRGAPIAECLRHGNACGALSTRQPGGSGGQPSRQQLKKFLESN